MHTSGKHLNLHAQNITMPRSMEMSTMSCEKESYPYRIQDYRPISFKFHLGKRAGEVIITKMKLKSSILHNMHTNIN